MRFLKIFSFIALVLVAIGCYKMFDTNLSTDISIVQPRSQAEPVQEFTIVNNILAAEPTVESVLYQGTAAIDQGDYYSQALSLLADAESGQAEAQFQLAEIISYCETINAWNVDFEHNFALFKAMSVSEADLLYMEYLAQEAQNCAAFAGQNLDIFSGQPIAGLSGLQIVSLWHLQAALQGHQQAAINGLHSIPYITNINVDTKLQLKHVIEAGLPSLTTESYFGLAAHADSELSQLALVKLGCAGSIKCDNIDSVPFAHINFYGCMKSGVDEQIAGISSEPTNCAAQGLNHFIAEQSSKYSSDDLSARMQQIRQAAQQGDLQAMGLSAVAEWLQTDDSNK